MQNKRRKHFALASSVLALLLCTSLVAPQAFAVTAAEKRAEAKAITEQIDELQTGLNEMKALHDKAMAAHDEAVALRDEAARQIEEENARITSLETSMSNFAVEMYKDGGAATFLGVLLQTSSFQDFLTSWDRCSAITESGKSLLGEVREAKTELESLQATYVEQATRAEQQMKIAEASMKQIEQTQKDLRKEAEKVAKEAEKLEKKEEREVTDEKARKAEKDRKAKEAEIEKRAKQAAAAAATAAASAHAEASAAVLLGDGYFTNPCPTATNSSGFGYRDFDKSFHKGLDMAAAQGTPYYAADAGTVLYATNDGGYNGGAGNWIVISHGNGIVTKYMHSLTTYVKPGDQVERGQNIGLVGSTGQSTGPHLHFQVEVDGVAVNPLNYI